MQWYIIGDGDRLRYTERLTEEKGVGENVHFLGTKKNPYSYIRNCDIYVQPSYTEGYSTTICEAGILGKAIIGTKPSGGIRDQITDGEDGLIADATAESLAEAIKKLIENKELRDKFETNILKKNFEGKGEIQKFIRFLSE